MSLSERLARLEAINERQMAALDKMVARLEGEGDKAGLVVRVDRVEQEQCRIRHWIHCLGAGVLAVMTSKWVPKLLHLFH